MNFIPFSLKPFPKPLFYLTYIQKLLMRNAQLLKLSIFFVTRKTFFLLANLMLAGLALIRLKLQLYGYYIQFSSKFEHK